MQKQFEKQISDWESKENQLMNVIRNQEKDLDILKDHANTIVGEKSSMLSEMQSLKSQESHYKEKL